MIEDNLLPDVECFCDECVNASSTKLDKVFRQVIHDNHLGETEKVLPLYHNVLFEGLAAGYYELGLPADDVYLLSPEATPAPGAFSRSRSSSTSSATMFSDTGSVNVGCFACRHIKFLTFPVDRRRGSSPGRSVFNVPM